VNDQPANRTMSKAVQALGVVVVIGAFLHTAYSLLEGYWAGEVLGCSKLDGCNWVSHRQSPVSFYVVVVLDAALFFIFGWCIVAAVYGKKVIGK
jgi:hypothetical protein